MDLVIEYLKEKYNPKVEIVERKGLGHPDYICDSIAEEVSRKYSEYTLKKYGTILHHNLDKVLLIGGQSNVKFGGGNIVKPIRIIVAGRATVFVNNDKIPIGKIVLEASKSWIKNNFRYLDPEKHVIIEYDIGQGSTDLKGLFEAGRKIPLSNDTSVGVSYYPLTDLEKIVLETERYISKDLRMKYKEIGEDVKVMGIRYKDKITLTSAIAFVSRFIKDLDEYLSIKEEIREKILDFVSKNFDYDFEVYLNTADIPEKGLIYITYTGTSAENGDDGETGRGNRVNGLITPMRPMSMEAAAGKNPVSHVGKIYNVLAYEISKTLYEEGGAEEVYTFILSQIGRKITDPYTVYIKVYPEISEERIKSVLESILNENYLKKLQRKFIEGKISIF